MSSGESATSTSTSSTAATGKGKGNEKQQNDTQVRSFYTSSFFTDLSCYLAYVLSCPVLSLSRTNNLFHLIYFTFYRPVKYYLAIFEKSQYSTTSNYFYLNIVTIIHFTDE